MKRHLRADIRPLATLADINQALSSARNPRVGFQRALEILEQQCGTLRAWVVLHDPDSTDLKIEASEGLPPEGQRAKYKIGEGITGRVVQTGRPVVVPQISQEPMFLHRTGRRREAGRSETTFVCVPIPGERKAIGLPRLRHQPGILAHRLDIS